MAILAKVGLFPKTNAGILVIFFILTGLSLNSFSLLGASIFRRAQLSGITVVVVALIFGVAAQISAEDLSTAAVAILGLIFTPMTFVFHMIWMARYEHKQIAPNLFEAAPDTPWKVPGLVFWISMLVQIIVYPLLAALIERAMYYTDSHGRNIVHDNNAQPVVLSHFTKHYHPNWFYRTIAPLFGLQKPVVKAVNDVSLAPLKGQIMLLVGANGCGKSTTLNAIAGLGDVTSGSITVNGSGGIGICPQRNVLWENLTVAEHAKIFNRIKSATISPATDGELSQLIYDCGLTHKATAYSQTLSGGQKRKLQLIMMLTGGSRVCCVDEVSGGLDPLSRRKIWDILLAARGTRTIVLTTHFLDEAEFLADHMVIMSKGSVKAQGSVSQLKTKLGGGYRFHFLHGTGYSELPDVDDLFLGATKESSFDQTTFTIPDSARMTCIIKELEKRNITEYQVTGPTIEEAFMKLAGDAEDLPQSHSTKASIKQDVSARLSESDAQTSPTKEVEAKEEPLMTGSPLNFLQQAKILFRKRAIVLKRNYLPYTFAFLIPIIATALISILIHDEKHAGCSPSQRIKEAEFETLKTDSNYKPLLIVGPSSALGKIDFSLFQSLLPQQFGNASSSTTALQGYIHVVDTLDAYNEYIKANFSKVTPGGFFLDDDGPLFSYYSNLGFLGMYSAVFMQNVVDVLTTNTTILTSFRWVFTYLFRIN